MSEHFLASLDALDRALIHLDLLGLAIPACHVDLARSLIRQEHDALFPNGVSNVAEPAKHPLARANRRR